MPALSGREIRARLLEKRIERRLVVSPLLIPEEQCRDDQASIDVRLGFEFALVSPSSSGHVDEFESPESEQVELNHLYRKIYVRLGEGLVIHPHQFILGTTLEYIRLPADLMAYVVGRSTWGRLGLIVATAIGVHAGFSGALTLELRNLGETPLSILDKWLHSSSFMMLHRQRVPVAGLGNTAVVSQSCRSGCLRRGLTPS
jgi:dCTP deaminase